MPPQSLDLVEVNPFASLPMEFRLDRSGAISSISTDDIKLQKLALVRAARDRGLTVDHYVDESTCQEVFIVRAP